MRIISVRIRNFRAIDDLELPFVDDMGGSRPVTVISGPNGSGKTSILFAITNALRGATGYRTDEVPIPTQDDIRLPKSAAAGWTARQPEASVDIELQFSPEEEVAVPQIAKIVNQGTPPELLDGQLKVHWKFPPGFDRDGNQHPWHGAEIEPKKQFIRFWLEARKWAIRAWTRKMPGMNPDLLNQVGGIFFFPQDRNLRERVLGDDLNSRSRAATEAEPAVIDSEADFERPLRRERTVSEILHFLSDFANNRRDTLPDERNWEKRIQTLFHRVCSPKEYVGYLYREENPLGSPILQDKNGVYPLSHAASGEQVILEYITRLTFPSPQNRSIILIDEPEIHLHPLWIRQLYLALPKIGEENQYLLTTHSTELRQRAIADNAHIDLGSLDGKQ